MRISKLTDVFHRPVKSDPEINRLASASMASLQTQSQSVPCILNFQPSTSSNMFTSNPFPFATLSDLADATVMETSGSLSSTLDSQSSVIALLMDHIRALETSLKDDSDFSAYLAALESALGAERSARVAMQNANAALTDEITSLREEVVQLRRDLFFALNASRTPSPPTLSPCASAACQSIVAERTHLHRLLKLVLSAGAHSPILACAYQRTREGSSFDDALAAALVSADPSASKEWARILAPLTDTRTQGEYVAQVRCTLSARAQAREWRARAAFWKRCAKEEGRHEDTVTPSNSALEGATAVDPMDAERRAKAEEMVDKLKAGQLPLHVARASMEDSEEPEDLSTVMAHLSRMGGSLDRISLPASRDTLEERMHMVSVDFTDAASSHAGVHPPASSSSMVLPTWESTSTATSSATLPATKGPQSDQQLSVSGSVRTNGASLSASSTQASVKSRRRHAKVLPSICTDASMNASLAVQSHLMPSSAPSSTMSFSLSPAQSSFPGHGCGSAASSFYPLPRTLMDSSTGSDEDLVVIQRSDFSQTSFARFHKSAVSSRQASGGVGGTPAVSAEKKPQRAGFGLRAFRRISMSLGKSRAPLVDTTKRAQRGRGRSVDVEDKGPSKVVRPPRYRSSGPVEADRRKAS